MKIKDDYKKYLIMGLCSLLIVMAVGYATFSSLLTINGTATLSNSFCVGFDNTKLNTYAPTAGISGGTVPTGSMSYSGTVCSSKYVPNSTLNSTFKQPGDKIEYTLTIGNKSTFTVAIKSIQVDSQTVTSNTTITKGNVKYIVEMPLSTTLTSNTETTMKITAMFQNDTDVTGEYTGENQSINVGINTEQDDGNGGFTPTPSTFTGTIYRHNTNLLLNGLTYNGEATVWYPTSNYSSVSEALADSGAFSSQTYCEGSFGVGNCTSGTAIMSAGSYETNPANLNKTYYLKHTITNDIVTASYLCFVYNNAEHCMQGGDGGASYSANQQILRDFQAFNNLPDNANPGCDWGSSHSYCDGGGFSGVFADPYGNVNILGSSGQCDVCSDGRSNCRGW